MTPRLSKKQFETFLMIYAAHVDYVYHESESTYIRSRTDEATYEAMLELYLNASDYSALKIVLAHKQQYFDTEAERSALYIKLIELLKVDGEYSRTEKVFLEFLDMMTTETE